MTWVTWELEDFPRSWEFIILRRKRDMKCTNPIIFGIWDGIIPSWAAKRQMKELKIPYESRKVHFNSHASHNFSPMNGLAGVVKKKIYLPQLLGHEWGKNCDAHGNWNVPWVMNGEFYPVPIFWNDRINIPMSLLKTSKDLHYLEVTSSFSYQKIQILQDFSSKWKKPIPNWGLT